MNKIKYLCITAGWLLGAQSVAAQTYPARPVRFVVGFAAGGTTDVIARLNAQDMSAAFGQSVIVENRPGANAQVAPEMVARATPDGHTLLYSALSLLVNAILLENRSGAKMTTVPFRGNAPALTEVIAGQVTYMFYPMVGIAEYVSAKRLRALAVGTAQRHPDFPDVPTMSEAGFPGFEDTAPWVGLLAPAGTPAAIVRHLSAEMRKSLARPETVVRMKALGAVTAGGTPEAFAQFLKKDHERWARVIKASGVKAE